MGLIANLKNRSIDSAAAFSTSLDQKKQLRAMSAERETLSQTLAIQVYQLFLQERLDCLAVEPICQRMQQLDAAILAQEQAVGSTCICGFRAEPGTKFCPNCGAALMGGSLPNSPAGAQASVAPAVSAVPQPEVRRCACGAEIGDGQFICMECGRKVEA